MGDSKGTACQSSTASAKHLALDGIGACAQFRPLSVPLNMTGATVVSEGKVVCQGEGCL